MGQLLTERVVLSAAGGVLGLAAAEAVLRGLPAVVPGEVARLDAVGLSGTGLAFTLALSVVVGLAFVRGTGAPVVADRPGPRAE